MWYAERFSARCTMRDGALLPWGRPALGPGRGAFGTVRICLDEQTGELLAAKVIECDPHAPDVRATLQQLEAEVRIMRRLGHPRCAGRVR